MGSMMKRFSATLAVLLLSAGMCAAADAPPVSQLEQLFEAGSFMQFFEQARARAKQGDPDAQFLLGKAYALGKGAERDDDQAQAFYELAAQKKHARAIHNLGLLLGKDDPQTGLLHLNHALALGFHTPTRLNIALTQQDLCLRHEDEAACIAAGDAFAGFWEKEKKATSLESAAKTYGHACLLGRPRAIDRGDKSYLAQYQANCKRGIEWTEKGASQGLAGAALKRAEIDMNERRWKEAAKWLEVAWKGGAGAAAFALARMHDDGTGVERSTEQARIWYMRGAILKDEQSLEVMLAYWSDQVERASDAAELAAAKAELAKIEPDQETQRRTKNRPELIYIIERNVNMNRTLSKETIGLHFCPDNVGEGPSSTIPPNSDWQIRGVSLAKGPTFYLQTPVLAKGQVDAKGCLTLSASGMAALQKSMAKGRMPLLRWPGRAHLLYVRKAEGELRFQVAPVRFED